MDNEMFASRRERVLTAIRTSTRPLDDVELSRRSGVRPRQTVNTICHALATEGIIERLTGPHGLIVNRLISGPDVLSASMLDLDLPAPVMRAPARARAAAPTAASNGDVIAQLGRRLGLDLAPRRISHPSGAQVGIDGVATDNSVLVQAWTAAGPATPAQRAELVAEAVKLFWIGRVVTPMPRRLLICAVDPEAIAHLTPRSWQSRAIADLGVEVGLLARP
ncbi:hypothetical protein [Nostocoides vanveenii]|uniref:Uncharacterized protein n=1 Tax=Nostocoides vanveenii TaxID=330835 RepID=A0ABN2KSD2_9MICO